MKDLLIDGKEYNVIETLDVLNSRTQKVIEIGESLHEMGKSVERLKKLFMKESELLLESHKIMEELGYCWTSIGAEKLILREKKERGE